MKTVKRGADWVAWGVQFIFGFVAGILTLLAYQFEFCPPSIWLLGSRNGYFFLLGSGLLVGAAASLWGDRVWDAAWFDGDLFSRGYIFPPADSTRSKQSVLISVLIGLAGMALIVTAWWGWWAPI